MAHLASVTSLQLLNVDRAAQIFMTVAGIGSFEAIVSSKDIVLLEPTYNSLVCLKSKSAFTSEKSSRKQNVKSDIYREQ